MHDNLPRATRTSLLSRAAAAVLLLTLLGGCGGGGGGNSAPTPTTPTTPTSNQPPDARFDASTTDGFAPLIVTFDASATVDPDGAVTDYQWDFDDGSATASGRAVTHTFADTGAFTVSLRVTDDDGLTDATSRTIRVRGATVSGVIRIGAGSSVDSDVNDRLTTPVSNNGFGSAQAVADPLRLGGFVNLPGTGSDSGNFRTAGDPDDYFFVELDGNERIVLSIGDPSADLDLELYNDDPTPLLVDASVSPDPATDFTEDLTVPAPGGYFVRVKAVSGASTYVLNISDESTLSLGRQRAKRLSDPFVPGELLLAQGGREPIGRYRLERARRSSDYRLASADRAASRVGPPPPDMRLPDVATAPGSAITPLARMRYRTLLAARSAAGHAGVDLAEVNVLRHPLRKPDDDFYARQWHYPAISLEQAWDLTTGQDPGTPDVVVAVVDTGVLLQHPDLDNQLLRDGTGNLVGYDFIQDPERANDGDGIDADPDDPGDDARGPGQGSFHGTHVAGTVAAQSDNGIGVAGVSWGARLMPLRALGVDGGTTFDVMQAVRYAAGLSNVSGTTPTRTADIVNLSLGSDFYSEAEQRTINQVRAGGVFLVASAGNDASDVPSYPAAYNGVVSVSASTLSGSLAPYSNFGPEVDVAAPGGDSANGVLSTLAQGGAGGIDVGYGFLQGTSMAAPHVSGVIALMKSVYPDLSPGEFDALLQAGALTDDAGSPGRDDRFGWGIINANKAVLAALDRQGGSPGPVISTSTSKLDFQTFTQLLAFSVDRLGDQPLTVQISDDAAWLTISALDTGADGFGQYQAQVDRSDLGDGSYVATITIRPDDPTVTTRTIAVTLQVTSPDVNADAGQHYVVLLRTADDVAVAGDRVNAVSGEYRFRLDDVPPGEYRLFAGTDLDDDDFICDGGEACGAFPDLSSPATITVDARQQAALTDQSFTTEYRTTATITAAASSAADSREDAPGVAVTKRSDAN